MPSLTDLGERLFAHYYARGDAKEPEQLRALRSGLLAAASGRTLEVGAGSGANLPYYPAGVTELVLTEPSRHMLRYLRRRLGQTGPGRREVVPVGVDALPFGDDSFDTVVATLVLCSVPDVPRALEQIARVLRPGGRFLFLEHVRARPGTRLARLQDMVERPHRALGAGCRPNRRTGEMIQDSPLTVTSMRPARNPYGVPWVWPLIVGTAIMGR